MNKRIEKLKQQAMVVERSHGAFGEPENFIRLDADKFAELIVKECSSINFRGAIGCSIDDDVAISKLIMDHFGVKT